MFGQPTTPLGVCGFGQSGSRKDLYRCMRIDEESILEAAFARGGRNEPLSAGPCCRRTRIQRPASGAVPPTFASITVITPARCSDIQKRGRASWCRE